MNFVVCKDQLANCCIVSKKFSEAGEILKVYLEKITGGKYEIFNVDTINPSIILKQNKEFKQNEIAYRIFDKDIIIEAENQISILYAIYDFLENIIGCKYYSKYYEYIPFDANLILSFEDYRFNPIIQYRETYYKEFENPEFAHKHKAMPAKKHYGWGFWCHSFEILVSPEKYFDQHPEYFSLYQGKRIKENGQLCLSNPEVLKVLVENLKQHINQNPDAKYWSISQNDNNAYCQCENCKKLDDIDGGPIGSILTFVNKVAKEFPDKIISTLAYWYSCSPPKVTKPAENVHIMLCNIGANRGLPIESDPVNQASKNELLAWKEICGNVFLWDYCIQFRNLVSPFPNLRVLAPNIKFFAENNVTSLFSQANREIEGEFAQLRGYMLAKLSWDINLDPEKVMDEFLEGYYKQAGKHIKQYINLIHDELEKSGGNLNIFGGPLDGKSSYLSRQLFDKYNKCFDEAENSVKLDRDALFRVKTARLPLYYAGIVLNYGNKNEIIAMLGKFANHSRKIGLEKVEEWKITTDKFVTDSIAKIFN